MSVAAAVILAAGKGTRMKSGLVKVLHPLAGQPMLAWPLAAARETGPSEVVIVAGHQADQVQAAFGASDGIRIALQEQQLGTGHAVSCALPMLEGTNGAVLILCGDTPLLTAETLNRLADIHLLESAAVTVLTAVMDNPFGYGRVVRDAKGGVCKIVEQKDATDEEVQIREVNSGIYCMDLGFLREHIGRIGSNNAQNEYYLTDLLEMAVSAGLPCRAVLAADSAEILGVNDRVQLAEAGAVLKTRINKALMLSGVTIVDPLTTYIDATVQIGADAVIWPGACLRGATVIGQGCVVESNVQVTDSSIGDQVVLKSGSVISEAQVASHVAIGPMAHLRPGSVLGEHVKIGNFVETKKVVMAAGAKASHLTYLGDAEIGRDVNIGCGTITCNYDGKNKHKTVIEDDVFIGSDVQLVAPVRVGRNSLVAAGTTVTADVPPDSLAIARTPQVNKEGWRLKKGS